MSCLSLVIILSRFQDSKRKFDKINLRFLDRIPNDLLANLSFKTESYHRSAFYLDQTLANRTEALRC